MANRKKRASGEETPAATAPPPVAPAWHVRRLWILVVLVVAVIAVLASKQGRDAAPAASAPEPSPTPSHAAPPAPARAGIPRLVDLGADKCIPCKAMAPILVELRAECAGRLQVDFIDVWKDPSAGDPYNIYAIPTQIFFDGDGKELTRHEGFISKADILATWKRFGYDFSSPGAPAPRS